MSETDGLWPRLVATPLPESVDDLTHPPGVITLDDIARVAQQCYEAAAQPHQHTVGPSSTHCLDCGAEVPEGVRRWLRDLRG